MQLNFMPVNGYDTRGTTSTVQLHGDVNGPTMVWQLAESSATTATWNIQTYS